MALAVAAAAAALLLGTKGEAPADDAWGSGQSLEWATASPPVPGNFGELPVVGSPEPLLDTAGTAEEA
jgi:heme/copper-type cytochrome/quinol oxidase subunit 1